jgi:hypothetical protein
LNQPLMGNGGYALGTKREWVGLRDTAAAQNQAPHCQVMTEITVNVEHLVALTQDSQKNNQEKDIA